MLSKYSLPKPFLVVKNVTSNLAALLQVIDVTLVFCTQQVYEFTNPLLVIVSDMLLEVKISKHKETYVRVHCNMCRSIQTHHRGQIRLCWWVEFDQLGIPSLSRRMLLFLWMELV